MSKYPNEYAAWRVSFQSDRQAAERAFDDLVESAHEVNQLDIELRECRRKLAQLHAAGLEMIQELDLHGLRHGVMVEANARLLGALVATESNKRVPVAFRRP
jgi:hypothetical protein